MYIMGKRRDIVVNSSQCVEIYISSESAIKARPIGMDAVFFLGDYSTGTVAQAVLNDLMVHIPATQVYSMPDDDRALILARGMSDDKPDKFAANGKKTVRRGGS